MRRDDLAWGIGTTCGLQMCLAVLPLLPLYRFLGWAWARDE